MLNISVKDLLKERGTIVNLSKAYKNGCDHVMYYLDSKDSNLSCFIYVMINYEWVRKTKLFCCPEIEALTREKLSGFYLSLLNKKDYSDHSITHVCKLHNRVISGDVVSDEEWDNAAQSIKLKEGSFFKRNDVTPSWIAKASCKKDNVPYNVVNSVFTFTQPIFDNQIYGYSHTDMRRLYEFVAGIEPSEVSKHIVPLKDIAMYVPLFDPIIRSKTIYGLRYSINPPDSRKTTYDEDYYTAEHGFLSHSKKKENIAKMVEYYLCYHELFNRDGIFVPELHNIKPKTLAQLGLRFHVLEDNWLRGNMFWDNSCDYFVPYFEKVLLGFTYNPNFKLKKHSYLENILMSIVNAINTKKDNIVYIKNLTLDPYGHIFGRGNIIRQIILDNNVPDEMSDNLSVSHVVEKTLKNLVDELLPTGTEFDIEANVEMASNFLEKHIMINVNKILIKDVEYIDGSSRVITNLPMLLGIRKILNNEVPLNGKIVPKLAGMKVGELSKLNKEYYHFNNILIDYQKAKANKHDELVDIFLSV